jgi:pyridoxine 5-phosphate synthase
MTKLSVNLNKIALLRNSRHLGIPSVTRAAQVCLDSGAAGITVHPRPDQRHIRPGDVDDLVAMLAGVEFNIEGNPFAGPEGTYPGFMEIVRKARPVQATLVPDDPGQLTSDHGWDLTETNTRRLRPLIDELKSIGVRVSLFMDAEPARMAGAADVGADRIELYTEPYARHFKTGRREESLRQYADAAKAAQDLRMDVNAGHDLSLENLADFLAAVPNVLEVSIGHALVCEALEMGLSETVRRYVGICSRRPTGK